MVLRECYLAERLTHVVKKSSRNRASELCRRFTISVVEVKPSHGMKTHEIITTQNNHVLPGLLESLSAARGLLKAQTAEMNEARV